MKMMIQNVYLQVGNMIGVFCTCLEFHTASAVWNLRWMWEKLIPQRTSHFCAIKDAPLQFKCNNSAHYHGKSIMATQAWHIYLMNVHERKSHILHKTLRLWTLFIMHDSWEQSQQLIAALQLNLLNFPTFKWQRSLFKNNTCLTGLQFYNHGLLKQITISDQQCFLFHTETI